MMTETEYRAALGVNKSTLWLLHKSPAHYQHALTHPMPETDALRLGRAVHAAVLTPTAFSREYATMPEDYDRRTKAGKERYAAFTQENAGKALLTVKDGELIRNIRKAVRGSDAAMRLLRCTRREIPIFWTDEETGLPCKCRVDAVGHGAVIDLKTTADASTDAFTRDAFRRGYDVQAAHYLRGARAKYGGDFDFWFIAVEKEPPFAVNVLHADTGIIDYGTLRLNELLQQAKECAERGTYPAYGQNEMILPEYLVF